MSKHYRGLKSPRGCGGKRRNLIMAIAGCIFLLLASAPELAAQSNGTISGRVTDNSGAVIPGAAITLTNTATGGVRSTVSTASGDYTFPAVPPGLYNIKASQTGFKIASSQNVQLQVQQSLTQNFTMQVGGVTQSVEVSASSDLLQTQNSALGTVVRSRTMPLRR